MERIFIFGVIAVALGGLAFWSASHRPGATPPSQPTSWERKLSHLLEAKGLDIDMAIGDPMLGLSSRDETLDGPTVLMLMRAGECEDWKGISTAIMHVRSGLVSVDGNRPARVRMFRMHTQCYGFTAHAQLATIEVARNREHVALALWHGIRLLLERPLVASGAGSSLITGAEAALSNHLYLRSVMLLESWIARDRELIALYAEFDDSHIQTLAAAAAERIIELKAAVPWVR